MKKQWKQDMHDRLKDFPRKAPEGLLDDVKAEMLRRGLSPVPAPRRRTVSGVFLRVASVAAVIALLFGLSHWFQHEETALVFPEVESGLPVKVDEAPVLPKEEATENPPVAIPQASRLLAKAIVKTDTLSDYFVEETIIEEKTEPEKEEPDTIDRPTPPSAKPVEVSPKRKQWAYVPSRKKRASFDVGVYYSGLATPVSPGKESIMMDFIPSNPVTPPSDHPLPPDGSGEGGNVGHPDNGTNGVDSTSTDSRSHPRVASRSFSRKKGAEEAKHHIPVRLGISLRYNLNERWNLQSGLTYSYLASDFSYHGSTPYETKQKLHYIGIPLQVGLRIWKSERFRGYLSAGGQVEKLVSGKATTRYTDENQRPGTLVETVSDKKLLFSVLASIGAEYMLGKDLSLYAEPGIHYYFKNGNGLSTHYNENPLSLNITIGFRFHWEK